MTAIEQQGELLPMADPNPPKPEPETPPAEAGAVSSDGTIGSVGDYERRMGEAEDVAVRGNLHLYWCGAKKTLQGLGVVHISLPKSDRVVTFCKETELIEYEMGTVGGKRSIQRSKCWGQLEPLTREELLELHERLQRYVVRTVNVRNREDAVGGHNIGAPTHGARSFVLEVLTPEEREAEREAARKEGHASRRQPYRQQPEDEPLARFLWCEYAGATHRPRLKAAYDEPESIISAGGLRLPPEDAKPFVPPGRR